MKPWGQCNLYSARGSGASRMRPTLKKLVVLFFTDESGQGITEYGAILAMVAVLVGVCFSLTSGKLTSGILQCYSAITTQLNNLSSGAGAASG
jgi:Flp pilus assembly pilin Flp